MDLRMLPMHKYIYNYYFLDFSYKLPIICDSFIVESDLMKGGKPGKQAETYQYLFYTLF